jgi:hypothetical protein
MRIILKTEFVRRLETTGATVQSVGEVADKPGMVTHIFIAVHYPRRDDEHPGTGFSQEEILANPEGRTVRPVIPEDHPKIPRPVKTKKVGLLAVGVGASPHPRVGD